MSEVSSSTDKPKIFMDFPINDVSKVVIRKKEGSVTLAKGETSWEVSEREGYPATTDPVIQLLRKRCGIQNRPADHDRSQSIWTPGSSSTGRNCGRGGVCDDCFVPGQGRERSRFLVARESLPTVRRSA